MTVADPEIRAWLRQARADLEAGRNGVGPECHRRYWLQQACEKGIKALGILYWKGSSDDGRFKQIFLHRHSPLKQLAAEVSSDPTLPRSLRFLLRQLESELEDTDGQELLRKVDSTTPTTDAATVSYRYPFRDSAGHDVAPVDWSTQEWDAYQGNVRGVASAIDRFLTSVDTRRRRDRS